MLKNYFKIALRNITKHRIHSLITILGLAFGIAACLVIYLYVAYEKSYDTFNINADNIYRLKNVRYYTSGTDSSACCISILGPTMEEDFPEVVDFSRVKKMSTVVTANNNNFREQNIFWADSSFLTMFSFNLIEGVATAALTEKNCAVLTKSYAEKYFGNINALGKRIRLNNIDFKITGITENVPPNSHMKFDILLSFDTQLNDNYCWACNNTNTYIQVTPGTKKTDIEAKLPSIVSKLHDRQMDGFDRAYFLQPLKDIHLYSNLRFEHEKNGNAESISFLSFIAIIIVLLAWINFINLSTARSLERAKEVGVRKVVGAGFWTLVRQFLLETFIINLIAVSISVFIVELAHPYWYQLVGIPDSFSFWEISDLSLILTILVFLIPLIGGVYPAFILSSYSPVSILRGSFKNSLKGMLLRKGLVIFQFSISIALIVAIIVFDQQLSFMQNKNLGFNVEQKLIINAPSGKMDNSDKESAYNTFINELQNQSLIKDATFSSIVPGMENTNVTGGVRTGIQDLSQGKQVYFSFVAQNYFDFFDIDLVLGRTFFDSELRKRHGSESQGLIINESALSKFGFTSAEEAIGASIYSDSDNIGNIIGVSKDYHQQSLDKRIKPLIFIGVTRGNYFVFNMNTENVSEKIESIKANFSLMFPDSPFEYNFLDQFFDRQYKADIQTTQILSIFSFLSIFISCLGLVGLSSLMIIQKRKEVGIRKILGASSSGILLLLTKEFVKWVLVANLIAWPIAYYFMNEWLQNFAYIIDLTALPFFLAGLSALLFALLTVSYQAVKAAQTNPVDNLRSE